VRLWFPAPLALLSIAAWIVMWTAAPARAESLDSILASMDRTSKDFKSMSARIKQTDYTAVIDETNIRAGELHLKRAKGGLIALVNFETPEPRVIHLSGHKAEVYYPKAKTIEVYDTGKYSGAIDQLLLLGFGTSVEEMKKDYTIKLGGAETVDGVPANRLDLTPKTAELQKNVTTIQLWIPEGKSNPLQEKILKSSRDYTLISYSGLQLNPQLPDSAFALNRPEGVREIHPQK
jgi:outer membrane lipoprotein-sorting protein